MNLVDKNGCFKCLNPFNPANRPFIPNSGLSKAKNGIGMNGYSPPLPLLFCVLLLLPLPTMLMPVLPLPALSLLPPVLLLPLPLLFFITAVRLRERGHSYLTICCLPPPPLLLLPLLLLPLRLLSPLLPCAREPLPFS